MLIRGVNAQVPLPNVAGGVQLAAVQYDGLAVQFARVYWRARLVCLVGGPSVFVAAGLRVPRWEERSGVHRVELGASLAGERVELCKVEVYDLVPGDLVVLYGRCTVGNVWALAANGWELLIL